MEFRVIGNIRTPFKTKEGMPIQPAAAKGIRGSVEINPEFENGLQGLEGFSHIILIYYFHKSEGFALKVKPFLSEEKQGVFATRAPKRPNAIGMSVVKLLSINNNILEIENVDILDGTPLLDIKPYVPEFDNVEDVNIGWLENKINDIPNKKSDKRFS